MDRKINWQFCQNYSDQILAEGIFELQNQPEMVHSQIISSQQGNYLISLTGCPQYIGEAKKIVARIKQQFKPKPSTFYKTFANTGINEHSVIDKFTVQHISTNIGRKEIEEFGIVNLPTKLNKFQQGKRKMKDRASTSDLWLEVQSHSNELLLQGERELLTQMRVLWYEATIPFISGIYIVQRGKHGEIIYIGESSDIGARYKTHSGDTYFSALRRHIGTELLGFKLKIIAGKKRCFYKAETEKIDEYLRDCKIGFLPVSFGRFELEEFVIRKNHPILNRKDNAGKN